MDPAMDVNRSSIPARSDLTGLYHVGRTLGRGHYAVVKLARQINTGQLVAIKMIDKTKLDIMATSHLLQEVRCMRLVQHPNVVRLYEVVDTPTTLYLIMELAEGGDLYDYILRHEGGVAEATAKRHFAQIVRAVAYCHQLHVVHRDLKPENVVFFPQQGAVKLTDFGFSNLFQPGTMLATSCGSLAYSAPEILLGEEYDAPAVDIWSLGVILYMLVCGVPPFQETNDSETLVMILDCRYCVPEHVSHDCKDLISRMLQKDPSRRASLEEIQAHGWLQGLNDALLSPEAPPHWLSGTMSPGSPRAGLPECGDLLAARSTPQQPFPGPCQPALSFTLRPPTVEEPPAPKSLLALQQICEEEEEEEEEEEVKEAEEKVDASLETEAPVVLEVDVATGNGGEEPPAGLMEIREEEVEEEGETGSEEGGAVISDQPISHGPPCCQLLSESPIEEPEPNNNNTHKPPPPEATPTVNMAPPSPTMAPPPNIATPPSLSATALILGDRDSPEAEGEGVVERTAEAGGFQAHNAPGVREEAAATAMTTAKVERGGKRHSVKLRERLFHFPLCEKALAFNLPSHNKPKILPLAQYNCCHVL